MQLVLTYCSPSKLDSAVALCLRVQDHAYQFARYSPQSIAHSLNTASHERIANLLDAVWEPWQRRSLLREIVTRGNTRQLERLVRCEVKFDWKGAVKFRADRSGATLLMSACINNNSDMVAFLICEGAMVHARNKSQRTALHLAASNNSVGAIDVLLKNGASVEDGDADGLSALHHAAKNGHFETIVRLVERGCDIFQKTAPLHLVTAPEYRAAGWTALHFASQNGHSRIAELLISRGVDVDCKTAQGCTPLMLASQGGHLETVRKFLRLGSDVGELDDSSYSALQYAARNGHLEIAAVLIDSAAEIARHVHRKDLAKLLISAATRKKPKLLDTLLKHGCSSGSSLLTFWNGGTLLHQAANVPGNADAVRVLLRHGTNIEARDRHGMTALHYAADTQIAALLLSSGSDLGATDDWGEVAAFHAARANRYQLVQFFVQQGCEVGSLSLHGFSLNQLLVVLGIPLWFKPTGMQKPWGGGGGGVK